MRYQIQPHNENNGSLSTSHLRTLHIIQIHNNICEYIFANIKFSQNVTFHLKMNANQMQPKHPNMYTNIKIIYAKNNGNR